MPFASQLGISDQGKTGVQDVCQFIQSSTGAGLHLKKLPGIFNRWTEILPRFLEARSDFCAENRQNMLLLWAITTLGDDGDGMLDQSRRVQNSVSTE